jgi:phosphatidate cytidylyltransferase
VLKQRIITAVILLLGLILATTLLSSFNFAILIALIVLLASWEWGGFIGLTDIKSRLGYSATLAVMLIGLFFMLRVTPAAESIDSLRASLILGLGLLFWLAVLLMLKDYPHNAEHWNDKSKTATMGLLTLLPTWVGIVQLKYLLEQGYLVFALVIMVSAVDIGAYFAGIRFGHNKLAPQLSPNKSWEGVWGGLSLCLLLGLLLIWALHTYLLKLDPLQIGLLILLSLAVTFFDVIGDLMESMLKRNRHIKDSGALLPGHGGILDRVDGLIAVVPSFVLTLLLVLSDLGDL